MEAHDFSQELAGFEKRTKCSPEGVRSRRL